MTMMTMMWNESQLLLIQMMSMWMMRRVRKMRGSEVHRRSWYVLVVYYSRFYVTEIHILDENTDTAHIVHCCAPIFKSKIPCVGFYTNETCLNSNPVSEGRMVLRGKFTMDWYPRTVLGNQRCRTREWSRCVDSILQYEYHGISMAAPCCLILPTSSICRDLL